MIKNTLKDTYDEIWYQMPKKGAEEAKTNSTGLYDVYILNLYRGLVGGKPVLVTPDPELIGEAMLEEYNKESPMVIAVSRPGRPSGMIEWMEKHRGEFDVARDWRYRATKAEKLVQKLQRDVEYSTPEAQLEDGATRGGYVHGYASMS